MRIPLILITAILCACNVTTHAQTANARYRLIDSLLKKGSMGDALSARRMLEGQLSADSVTAGYWQRYSTTARVLFKYEVALKSLNKAISLDPANPELYYEKGRLCNDLNDPASAQQAFSEAIKLDPQGRYFYWRAIMEQQQSQWTTALEDYTTALEKKFETPQLYFNCAILLFELERYSEAMTYVNKALALDPKSREAYSVRSKIHFFNADLDSACADKDRAIALGNRNVFNIPANICSAPKAKQYRYVAEVLAGDKFCAQATLIFTKLIAMGHDSANHYLNRGYCYYQLKDYDKAEKDYLAALQRPNPAKDMIWDNLSLLYYDMGKYPEAIAYSTRRIELNPRNHVAYIDRGLCLRKLKRYKEAEKDFNASLAIKPDFFRAFGYRAFLYLELGQYEKARLDAQQSVTLYPTYAYGYLVLAQAKKELGFPDYCVDLYSAKKHGDPDADKAIEQSCK